MKRITMLALAGILTLGAITVSASAFAGGHKDGLREDSPTVLA